MTTQNNESDIGQPAQALDQFLTPEQVAQRLQIAVRTVRFHAQTGQLPAVRIGNAWRFPASKLARRLDRRLRP